MSQPPKHVILGPLTSRLLNVATWKPHNEFPAHQSWADEFESALIYLDSEGVLDRFIHRLSLGERGVWAEIWAAHYFNKNSFKVTQWEPEYVPNAPGDLEVVLRTDDPIFVEVKRPGWQGELSSVEYDKGRHEEPKYQNGDCRSYDNVPPVIHSVRKALPKFCASSANVIVIVDDLFVSPLDDTASVFLPKLDASLNSAEFDVVTGIFLLNLRSVTGNVEYRGYFHRVRGLELPGSIRDYFFRVNRESEWSDQRSL